MIFLLNGTDYSSYFAPNSISVSIKPVYSKKVTTLDGVSHNRIIRFKSTVSVQVMPLTRQQAMQLSEELVENPISVTYENPYFGTVTNDMQCDSIQMALAIRDSWREYWKGKQLVFVED